jgi:steroid delta-isomerase-like uncharacterized protein
LNINHLVDVPRVRPPQDRDVDAPPPEENAMGTTSNATIVREFLDAAWNRGDVSGIERLVAVDHADHGADGDDVGRDHLVEEVREYRAAFPDLKMSFEDQISESDRVVTRWTARGTNLGPFQGVAATGRQATVSGIFICRVVGGRITETWSSFDRFGLAQQLRSPKPTE